MQKDCLRKYISYGIFALFIGCVAITFYIQGHKMDYSNISFEFAYKENDRIALGIAQCANDEIQEGKEMRHALYDCGTGHRSFGDTGDFFAVDLINHKMLVDNSPDCMKNGTSRNFDEQGECSMHSDPARCALALKDIYNLKDRTWWKFDDAREFISCVYIPAKQSGYKGPLGINGVFNKNNAQVVVCIGMQEDEIRQQVQPMIDNVKTNMDLNQVLAIFTMIVSLLAVANLKSKN